MLIQCLIANMSSFELLNFAYLPVYGFGKTILIYNLLKSFLANNGKLMRTMEAILYTTRMMPSVKEPVTFKDLNLTSSELQLPSIATW